MLRREPLANAHTTGRDKLLPPGWRDTSTLAVMVLGSEIRPFLFYMLILVFFSGIGQPYMPLGWPPVLRLLCKVSS